MYGCGAWLEDAPQAAACACAVPLPPSRHPGALLPAAQVEKKQAEAKREADAVKWEQRGRGVVQRRLNRAELAVKEAQEALPGLANAVHNMRSQLGGEQRAQAREAEATRQLAGELAELVEVVAAERKLVSWRKEKSRGFTTASRLQSCQGDLRVPPPVLQWGTRHARAWLPEAVRRSP